MSRLSTSTHSQLTTNGSHGDRHNYCLLLIKFIYSENATKFCEISTVDLSYVVFNGQIYGGNFNKFSSLSQNILTLPRPKYTGDVIPLNMTTANSIPRECVSTGAAGARTRRSFGHHLLHLLFLRLLVLCAPADFKVQSSLLQIRLHPQIQIFNACPEYIHLRKSER